jgi:ankyrin repeat protein
MTTKVTCNSTLDNQLYLLALVLVNRQDALRQVFKLNCKFEFDLNFVYNMPIECASRVIEEVRVLIDEANMCIKVDDDNFWNVEFMQRLLAYYNIKELDVNLVLNDQEKQNKNGQSIQLSCQPIDHIDWVLRMATTNNTYFQFTILHIAVLVDCRDLVQLLVDAGASIKPFKTYQLNPIHLSLYTNNNDILDLLLGQLSDEDKQIDRIVNKLYDDKGYNPLHIAVYYQNSEAVDLLYEIGADLNYSSDTTTYPIIWALENIDIDYDFVRKLMDLGASPNVLDRTQGYTPLILAILAKRIDLVRLVIQYDANVNVFFDDNDSCCCALQLAIDQLSSDEDYDYCCIGILLSAGADPTFYDTRRSSGSYRYGSPLVDAITLENRKLVEFLLDCGANPNTNTVPACAYSPLCTAAFLGNLEIVELLLNRGVDPTISCQNSNTPLAVALLAVSIP